MIQDSPIPLPDPSLSEDEYRALLERVPAIVYIAEQGVESQWIYVNRQIERVLGFAVEEWLADTTLWVRQLHPDDRERAIGYEEETADQLGDDPTATAAEYRMLHRSGRVVWIRDESVLIPQENGPPRWYGVLADVTAEKQVDLEFERQAAATAAIAELGEMALKRAPIAQLLERACQAAATVLGVDGAVVARLGADQHSLELVSSHWWDNSAPVQLTPTMPTDSQPAFVLRTGQLAQVDDWLAERRFTPTQPVLEFDLRSSLCVRIEGDGSPFGVFTVVSRQPYAYSLSDGHFVQALANVISDAIERQRIEDAIEHRALHDPLTGLPNRVLFLDRVEQAFERVRRHRNLAAVLFIDVDHFKQINDTLGHHAGDDLLIGVATRLRETVRPTDTVARFGGDEFGLLLDDITSERDAIGTAERIAASFARPFVLEAGSHFVTVSIGIALTDGHELPADLLRNADTAMYRAKERGRARYDLFDEDMRIRAIARLRLEGDLRRALEQQELRITYQPLVHLRDESICGVEALVRWDHPQRGPIPPAEFIPVAEDSGLIDRLGQWVFEEACRDAIKWAQVRPDSRPLELYVNISTSQLANARFSDLIIETLDASGLSGEQLWLEVSESLLLEDGESSRRTLSRLSSHGVSLVVDDFGTGHSSLSQLGALPVAAVKLDRSFVAELRGEEADSRMTRAVVAMAKAMDLGVIATGAETIQQVAQLHRLGCDSAQGYLFSEPVEAEEITAMLQDGGFLNRFEDRALDADD